MNMREERLFIMKAAPEPAFCMRRIRREDYGTKGTEYERYLYWF